MTTLTLALPLSRPVVGTEFSYVLAGEGPVPLGHGIAPLALLPRSDDLILVVPARLLSWHEIKLPPLSASRVRAALEGALEDRLLDEPASLAFAVAPQRGPQGMTLVAVCDKAWLQAALQFFELAQRPATRVVPEFEPASELSQRRLVVTGTDEEAWITHVDTHGALSVPLPAVSVLPGHGTPEFDALPLLAEPAVDALAEQVLVRPASIQEVELALLASSRSAWELAQFDLALSNGGRMARRWASGWRQFAHKPVWRMTRWGLTGLFVVNLVGLNTWAWSQDHALQAKRQQVKAVLSQTFPRVRTVVDAPVQMEREVALLRQASGGLSGRDMEVMLGAIGGALPDGQALTSIEFSPGEAVVKGPALDASQVALVSGKLSGLGYTTRLDGDRLVVRAGNGL